MDGRRLRQFLRLYVCRYNIEAVMLAFLVTCAAVAALTLFAVNTKVDVTRWHSILFVAMIIFLVLLFVGLFWINKILYLVIAGVGCSRGKRDRKSVV